MERRRKGGKNSKILTYPSSGIAVPFKLFTGLDTTIAYARYKKILVGFGYLCKRNVTPRVSIFHEFVMGFSAVIRNVFLKFVWK